VVLGLPSVVAAVVEIALGHDAKGADGGEQPAFRAVDLVHTAAFSHGPTLTSARKVEVLREYISPVSILRGIAVAGSATAAAASIANVAAVTVVGRSQIVSVPHCLSSQPAGLPAVEWSLSESTSSMSRRATSLQFAFGARRAGSVAVRCSVPSAGCHGLADGVKLCRP